MVEEFKKINLETIRPPDPTSDPPLTGKSSPRMGKILRIALFTIIGLIVLFGLLLLPLSGVIAKAKVVVQNGRVLGAAVKNQDLEKTKEALGTTRQSLTALDQEYNKVRYLKNIPLIGAYFSDGEHAIKAGFAGLTAGDKAVEALEPNADLLGLKGKGTFVSGTADERLQTAVKTMQALTPKINEIATNIDVVRKEIDAIDPKRYPGQIGKTKIREPLFEAKAVIENAANLFVNAQPLLVNLPKILGEPIDQRYLVLFQNDKELRATGGFITAYAQFRMAQGKPILERSDDIYALDSAMQRTFPAPAEILKYHINVKTFNLRDSNLSPDFKDSMQTFEQLYSTVAGREKIDGIITLDTHVLVEVLKILGPMTVDGRTFSAEIDKRCNCAEAIYELEDYSSRPVGYARTNRKGEIGDLLQMIMQQALGVSPSKYWGKLFQMFITEINQKHILAYFHDEAAEKAAESFNMAGRIMTATDSAGLLGYKEGQGWDYLHINNSNMAGAKSNMFTTQKYTKDVTVNGDGTLTTKLTLDYKNSFAGSDCNLESGGLCLNAPLRDWIRIYVPLGSKLVDSKGVISPQTAKAAPMITYDSLSKTVFEGFLVINPLSSSKVELTYTSPVKEADGKYRLLIQKQPGTQDDQWTIILGGRQRLQSVLNTDTELVY